MPGKIYAFNMQPGIQRDGTNFSSKRYIDGQWCRWYRGLPKKMAGFNQITDTLTRIARGTYVVTNTPNFNVYWGDSNNLNYIPINSNGTVLGPTIDRTPNLFPVNNNNLWSFDSLFSSVDDGSTLIAHAAPNLSAIDSLVETPVWYGEELSNSALLPTGFTTSGGIVVLHPYLFIFGNYGDVSWTIENNPTILLGNARVSATKIIAGFATRGGNSSPAGLLWSLDSLIRVTEVGSPGPIQFSFDTITSDSSILSSSCIVEYDGVYFWAAVDRFLLYNGVVQELPNDMSLEFFFSNINMAQRQKVWATKVSEWGEIWWHFPTGDNIECNHAVIYNVREQTWYDTQINRSSGYFEQTFSYPIWSDNSGQNYPLWVHEVGVDKNINNALSPIYSSFESGSVAWVAFDPNAQRQEIDRTVDLYRIEPDFVQSGLMLFIVNGREYARSPIQSSSKTWSTLPNVSWSTSSVPPVTWSTWGSYAFYPDSVKIDLREQRREMTLKFVSNVVGGNYELGQTLVVARIGDTRQ